MPRLGRRPRLLVVDDEPELAELIAEFARRAGYDATSTSNPDDFDRLYHHGIDVVVLDLWMPRRDGIELLRHLAERGSRARVILVSGFDERVLDAARGVAASYGLNVIGALSKPVRLAALTQLLKAGDSPAPEAARLGLDVTRAALQGALDDDRLVVHFQPQVSMRTREVVGVEALVRWQHADGALIPPDMFVEIAEAADLAQALTWRVIEKAGAVAETVSGMSISINLPPVSLSDVTFPDRVMTHLAANGLTASRLHFEMTETSVARDAVSALDILTRLRLKGFLLAIDDFGRGYSSLEQLRRLPFSELKIDRSFVSRMDRDAASRSIVEHCIALGHDLGLTVVAEGVETPRVWEELERAGCDVVQGYFVMRPAPPEELADWLRTRPTSAVGRGFAGL
jgi:EAL domain-containing protein (putative c-di-GMP-specific phosphodiesterase class I)/ActR/RegA family two-component response regulator